MSVNSLQLQPSVQLGTIRGFQNFYKCTDGMLGGEGNPKLYTLKYQLVIVANSIIKTIHYYLAHAFIWNVFSLMIPEVEQQQECAQLLQELAKQPSCMHKHPTNHYQHFVNAYVLTNQMLKWADAVKFVQMEWKE